MYTENKQAICASLLQTIQKTRAGKGIYTMEYIKTESGAETVKVVFVGGYIQYINVTFDSGIALIKDVMKEINY